MKVTEEEVVQIHKSLKKKKADEKEGWRNEDITEGGDEMVKSIKRSLPMQY